jgi:ornithine cyclodeaminase/alanine dehydrogenase-like protein (mu-crystallin family)
VQKILVLDEQLIHEHLSYKKVIELVHAAFAADVTDNVSTFPVVGRPFPDRDANFGIKSSYLKVDPAVLGGGSGEVLGLKTGGYWAQNAERGLPGHHSVIVLTDPQTGMASAIVAANVITNLRTAAGGAVAAHYLSRPESSSVAVIGAGEQAHAQLEALLEVRSIKTVRVWARRAEAARDYQKVWQAKGLQVEVTETPESAVRQADIVITTTPSQEPIVQRSWVKPGTHLNAIGSDSVGKQELEASLVAASKLVVDKIQQSITIGEMQQPLKQGLMKQEDIYAELGELCAGKKPGRATAEEITVFDSSGTSLQDMVVAGYLLELAKREGLGKTIKV